MAKSVKRIVMHPRYNTATNDYDIAVLEIEEPFDFDGVESFLRPICLPQQGDHVEHWKSCAVAGWGVLNHGDKYASRSLLMSDVPIVDKHVCQMSYSFLNRITNRMFCAGDYEHGQKGTCQVCRQLRSTVFLSLCRTIIYLDSCENIRAYSL